MKLPNPDSTELQHSEQLCAVIRAEINSVGGMLSFSRFMELALYAPGLGYYSAGKYKFGEGGDFVTAPEISPVFARTIARQCQQILQDIPAPNILELGAGSGVFAKDLLLELEKLGSLPQHYYILEVSADLRERQNNFLLKYCPHLYSRIIWLDSLPAEKLSGIIFANEVMDALPVYSFSIESNRLKERCVTWHQGQFAWQLTEPTTAALTLDYKLPNGYISEKNLLLPAWIRALSESLAQGVILLFDYGYGRDEYYHPDRYMGTLMCYYRHHYHDNPLMLVGLQDITAHVDFTSVAESALDSGCTLQGYTTQAGFLLAAGFIELAQNEKSSAVKRLIMPTEMGEAVKVIGLSKNFSKPLIGFALHDRRRTL